MGTRAALACSLAALGATLPLRALAEPAPTPPASALTWDAPATCPSADLFARVASLVGLSDEQLATKLLRVDAAISPTAGGSWLARLRIETAAGSGERSFYAEDCRSLIDGAALILALAVDPTATAGRMPSPALAAQPAERATSPRPRFLLRPLLAADIGTLPEVGLLYGLAAGLAWPSLRFEIDGSYQSPQTVADTLGHSGRVRLPLSSGARACVSPWRLNRIEPAACLGAAFAWLRSTGENLAHAETHDTLSIAVMPGVAVGLRLRDWLWLRADAGLGIVARRAKLQILNASQNASEVYSVPWLTGRVGGGLEFRL